jgi:hypothetical protein
MLPFIKSCGTEGLMSFLCPKCGVTFPKNQGLQKHLARKRPCDPILERGVLTPEQQNSPNRCRYCGRAYSRSDSLKRHLKTCKIASSAEGMEALMEHTLKQQLDAQTAEVGALKAQMAKLTALLEGQLIAGATPAGPRVGAATINIGQVANTTTTTTTNIAQVNQHMNVVNIRPWDGPSADRIHVPIDLITAAFSENPRLKEYCSLGDAEKTDPKVAPQYVLEMLMDLVKRAHADPAARNVYLNPRRADQALVCLKSGRWEVIQLAEATRLLFDGVVVSIHAVTLSLEKLRQLPLEAQNAMAMAGLVYRDEPEEYAKRAKGPMAAHLANTAPTAFGANRTPIHVVGDPLAARQEAAPVPAPALAPTPAPAPTPTSALAPPLALAPELAPPLALAPELAPARRVAVLKPRAEEKHFTQADAAALLRAHRPPEVGEVDPAFIKRLAREAGVDTGRVVRKLWEAAEDRLLVGDDDQTARAVCSVYDENPDEYD